jgi:hypothetical protein
MFVRLAVVAMLAFLPGCSTPGQAGTVAAECQVAADLAGEMQADNVNATAAGKNCKAAFQTAGIPMLGMKKPSDKDAPGLTHEIQFKTITLSDADHAQVTLDYACNVWCGHGEEIIAERRNGRWTIASRKQTWVS